MKILMFTLLSIFTLFSCRSDNNAAERKPENMLSFSYYKQGMARYGNSYFVKRNGDATLVEVINGEDTLQFATDTTIFADLQVIINKYKIYKYKSQYSSRRHFSDGESWGILVQYVDNNQSISTRGTNAGPKGGQKAIDEIMQCFNNRINDNKRQPATMLSFSYHWQGTEAQGRTYSVTRNGDKAVVDINELGDDYHCTVDTSIFSDLQAIVSKNRMSEYNSSYQSDSNIEILDGESWSFETRYADEQLSISSRGSNAWPEDGNKAFLEIMQYFNRMISKSECDDPKNE